MDSDADQQREPADRPVKLWTGGERPYDPEDLVMATGADPTPERVEKARKLIEKEGPTVIERYLP
ncbi:hypothetical protein ABZZ20_04000 [Streptomyces sp. NPDC006430]|uniref:hypothetical protein n=1 Tax=Streptomyces sp. NPDC006430 TaxID=3154299 RepID=UPI0033BF02E9